MSAGSARRRGCGSRRRSPRSATGTQQRGRSLKLAREFAVGLAVVHPDRRFLDDPFIGFVASGLSNALAEAGYGLVVNGIADVSQVDRLLHHAMHIDALAIIASGPRAQRRAAYRRLAALPHPLVVIEDVPQRGLGDTCTVLQDDGGGGAALARISWRAAPGGSCSSRPVTPGPPWSAARPASPRHSRPMPCSSAWPATRPITPG